MLFSREIPENFAGFDYDPEQGIFTAARDAWQREFGYCRAYDDATPLVNMIIDCEPIYFDYAGKSRLIELWKGQYGMTTGAEIGVYYADKNVKYPAGAFYKCVKDADMLDMSIRLFKGDNELFYVKKRHWWLTGFILGEFSLTPELRAIYEITFANAEIQAAFTDALKNMGYRKQVKTAGLTVAIDYKKPLSKQPFTRTPEREREANAINKELCNIWREATGDIADVPEKLEFLKESNPDLYKKAAAFGVKRFLI